MSLILLAQEPGNNQSAWGFALGMETQTLGIESLDRHKPMESLVSSGQNQLGMTMGINYRKIIWRGLAFEPGLFFSYNRNKVNFSPGSQERFQFVDIELPLHLSVTNQKSGTFPVRGKILFGARTSWNFFQNPAEKLRFLPERLGLDLGLGVAIHCDKWIIYPEVVYSHGINNIHDFTGTEYDYFVGQAVRDKLAFRLLFERNK
ncbi:MAG: hypothetical protein R3A50_18905 [Saprospiraceae bacterium]|nr:outer membrane beta-barrel protein [Saprospiraceae bacterium]MCB9342548.1 outer membrane beta-barrel protein [Lewinellaceae bacterium]